MKYIFWSLLLIGLLFYPARWLAYQVWCAYRNIEISVEEM